MSRYRPANKHKGEYNDYIKDRKGIVIEIVTRDKNGREICRWKK